MTENTIYCYNLISRLTPGAKMMIVSGARNLRAVRKDAKTNYGDRADLTYQDVRIERQDGTLVEYAGPCR